MHTITLSANLIDTLPRRWVKTGSGPRDTHSLAARLWGEGASVGLPGDMRVASGRKAVGLVSSSASGPWALVTLPAATTTTTTGNLIEGTSLGCLRATSEHLPAIVDALRRPPSGEASPAPLISAWLRETAIQHDPEAWESALPVEDWIDDHTIRLLPGGGGRDLQISRVALAEIFEAIAARAPALGWWGELEGTIRDASVVGGAGRLEEVALAAVREGVATRREADHWRALALRLSRRERERAEEVLAARRRVLEAVNEAEAARRALAEARAEAEVGRARDTSAAIATLGRALGELAAERAAREDLTAAAPRLAAEVIGRVSP